MTLAWDSSTVECISATTPSFLIVRKLRKLQQETDSYVHTQCLTFRNSEHRSNWIARYPWLTYGKPEYTGISTSMWRRAPGIKNVWIALCVTPNSTFVGLPRQANIIWHAWGIALIKDSTGKRQLLLYSTEPFTTSCCNTFVRHVVQLAKRSGHIERGDALGHKVFSSNDRTFYRKSFCLRYAIHWIRFIASFGDVPLVEDDPRLQGFVELSV